MKKEISLTISIPAYNEEQTIRMVAKQALNVVKDLTKNYELLLINDGSTDQTGKIIDLFAKKNSNTRVIHNRINSGFSGVITQSLFSGKKDYVFLGPADGQFDYRQMKKFVEIIGDSDVVTAYRTINAEPLQRKIQSAFYHLLAKFLFDIKLKEFTSVSLWKKSALKKIVVKSHPKSNMALIEIVYKIQKNNGKFTEVPIQWDKRKGGKPKGTINFKLIWLTFHQMLKLFYKERLIFSFNTTALILLVLLGLGWEIFSFIKFPKQAWVQGLTEAWFVSNGLSFYKDFLGTYTPFLRATMIPLHNIFGYTHGVTIGLYLVTSLSTFLLLFYATIKWIKGWARILPILFFTAWNQYLTGNHFTTPTFLGLICLLTFCLWRSYLDNKNIPKAFFIGILSGIGVFSMQILTPFVGVIFASLLFVSLNIKNGLKQFYVAILGFLTIAAPILLWLLKQGIFNDFYYWTIKYHFIDYPYTAYGKSLNDILVFLAVHSPLLLIFLPLFSLYPRNKFRGIMLENKNNFFLIFFILIILSLAAPIWFAIFHPIRFQTTLPLLSFALGLGLFQIYALSNNFRKLQIFLFSIILFFNVISWLRIVPSYYQRNFDYPVNKQIISKFYPDDPMYGALDWIKNNTPLNSKLFVLGDSLFYFEAKRLPSSTRATTNIPIAYQPRDKFINELKNKPPDYWVIDERSWKRFEDFGFKDTATLLKNLLLCNKLLIRIDYVAIYKQKGQLCI